MRRLMVAVSSLLIASSLGAQSPHKPVDPWIGADKAKHFLMAGFVESLSFAGLQLAGANRGTARVSGISAAAMVSVGREIHDRRVGKGFSFKDLAWDGLGIAAALLVVNKTQR